MAGFEPRFLGPRLKATHCVAAGTLRAHESKSSYLQEFFMLLPSMNVNMDINRSNRFRLHSVWLLIFGPHSPRNFTYAEARISGQSAPPKRGGFMPELS